MHELIFPDLPSARAALMGLPELTPAAYRLQSGELNGVVRLGCTLYYSLTARLDPIEVIRALSQ